MGILYSPKTPKAENIIVSLDPGSRNGISNKHTNLYSLPEDMSGATTFVGPGTTNIWYTFRTSLKSNAGFAPDGTSTATLMTDVVDGSSSTHDVRQQYNHSVGETVTMSIFAKANTFSNITLVVSTTNFADGIERGVNFNLLTGQTSYITAATPLFTIENAGAGWWRCSLTYTSTLASLNGVQIRPNNGSSSFYTGNGSGSLFIWGAMLSPGSTLLEYAPQSTISNYNKPNVIVSPGLNLNKNSYSIPTNIILPAQGQAEYTTPGTYSWTCPAGVTSVSAVCVGGGGGGNSNSGGTPSNGGDSYFISNLTVRGGGGTWGTSGNLTSGTYTGDGGGLGGGISAAQSPAAGGAGGYTGNGGQGMSYAGGSSVAGAGGGGGGAGQFFNGVYYGAGGGGVGIYGQGTSGSAITGGASSGGQGGSSGTNGTSASAGITGAGGAFGGGGGGNNTSGGGGAGLGWKNNISVTPGQSYQVVVGSGGSGGNGAAAGAGGAVRIMWGANRSFPNNASNVVTNSGSSSSIEVASPISVETTALLNSTIYNAGYLAFSGTSSSYASIFTVPTSDYISISAAVFLSSWTTATGTFLSNADTDGTTRYQLGINNASYPGNVGAIFKNRLGSIAVSFSRAGIASGWHILTATFDGSFARLYIDGSLVASSSTASPTILESLNYNTLTLAGKLSGGTVSESIACRLGIVTIVNQAYSSDEANSYFNTYRRRYGV